MMYNEMWMSQFLYQILQISHYQWIQCNVILHHHNHCVFQQHLELSSSFLPQLHQYQYLFGIPYYELESMHLMEHCHLHCHTSTSIVGLLFMLQQLKLLLKGQKVLFFVTPEVGCIDSSFLFPPASVFVQAFTAPDKCHKQD